VAHVARGTNRCRGTTGRIQLKAVNGAGHIALFRVAGLSIVCYSAARTIALGTRFDFAAAVLSKSVVRVPIWYESAFAAVYTRRGGAPLPVPNV
jgi:hypothetical protein